MAEPVVHVARVNAVFADESKFVSAVKGLVKIGHQPECYLPYPIHGFDAVLGLKRSLLGRPVMTALLFGWAAAIGLAWFTQSQDYPLNVGGKPFFAWPTFFVVILETGLLFAALANMALGMQTSKLLPDPCTRLIDDRLTDDHFAIVVKAGDEAQAIADRLLAQGAVSAVVVIPRAEEPAHA
jgi:hypothetical protein